MRRFSISDSISDLEAQISELEESSPDSLSLADCLERCAMLLKKEKSRLLDAANMEARAKVIRAKHGDVEAQPASPVSKDKESFIDLRKALVRSLHSLIGSTFSEASIAGGSALFCAVFGCVFTLGTPAVIALLVKWDPQNPAFVPVAFQPVESIAALLGTSCWLVALSLGASGLASGNRIESVIAMVLASFGVVWAMISELVLFSNGLLAHSYTAGLYLLAVVFIGVDSHQRQVKGSWYWTLATFIAAPVVAGVYLALRPQKGREAKDSDAGLNILKWLALFWTGWSLLKALTLATPESTSGRGAAVVCLIVLWIFPLLLGAGLRFLVLRNAPARIDSSKQIAT